MIYASDKGDRTVDYGMCQVGHLLLTLTHAKSESYTLTLYFGHSSSGTGLFNVERETKNKKEREN